MCLTLTACSEDVYQEAEMQNEESGSQYQTNSFNNANSGQYAGYGPGGIGFWGDNYISPWDIWFRGATVNGINDLQPSYLFTNGNMEDVTPYDIEVFAYAGLAYFDSNDDGIYNDPKTGFSAPIANGNYPTLYANGHEVGNLVKIPAPILMPAYPNPNSSFRIEDRLLHLPTFGTINPNPSPKYSTPYASFNFGPAGTLLTQDELDLLGNYGKIFFYEVHVYDKFSGALVLSTFMHPQITTLPNNGQDWLPVLDQSLSQVQGQAPMGNFDLYYLYKGLPNGTDWKITNPFNANTCDSREVVFHVPEAVAPYRVQIDPTFKLILDFQATGQTGWVNSALHLNVTGR